MFSHDRWQVLAVVIRYSLVEMKTITKGAQSDEENAIIF